MVQLFRASWRRVWAFFFRVHSSIYLAIVKSDSILAPLAHLNYWSFNWIERWNFLFVIPQREIALISYMLYMCNWLQKRLNKKIQMMVFICFGLCVLHVACIIYIWNCTTTSVYKSLCQWADNGFLCNIYEKKLLHVRYKARPRWFLIIIIIIAFATAALNRILFVLLWAATPNPYCGGDASERNNEWEEKRVSDYRVA